ncbi:hypothetical protein [Phaeocystidibacter luteus]|uniref:Uncharacterized protein n=1 Tax=Phaeocystidibacter luteus TaxID=911197 RepID=A0A6N6RGL4_9FLAO|nr:hypothetical protein [Phaeocystidibacter luteus]KAB2810295.1 hypothetical protein F8C67_06835 [Phaeocystidibacter luteus]
MWKWISVILWSNALLAQTVSFDWEQGLTSQELEQLQDELSAYEANPLALNSATIHELSAHPLISTTEAISIKRYIDEAGALLDWGELCEAHGINGQWIEARKPYLALDENEGYSLKTRGRTKVKASVGIQVDDPTKKGYIDNEYQGIPAQVQGKLEIKNHPYAFYWRWQQDAGEPIHSIRKGIIDHHSFNLQWNGGKTWFVSLGDYRLGHSTGILFGVGFGSAIPQKVGQIHTFFNPNTAISSASEFGTYRGVLARYQRNNWKLQLNLGKDNADARLSDGWVESYPSTGSHRTSTELQRKSAVTNWHEGIYIEKTWKMLRLFWAGHLLYFEKSRLSFRLASSMGGQFIYGTHFLDAELSTDHDNRLAFGMSYSKSFGDASLGMKIRRSAVDYQPSAQNANGLLFSGGGERSAIVLFEYGWKKHSLCGTAYGGYQRKPEWVTSKTRGWQLEYAYHNRGVEAGSRLRSRNKDESQSLHLRNYIKTTALNVEIGVRSDFHWSHPKNGTSMIATSCEFQIPGGKLRADMFYFSSGMDELPVWLMMRTTSMQMSVLRFSKSGAGINVYGGVQLSSTLKLEIRGMVNREFNSKSRGSGLDETPGGLKWAFNFELHYALR